MQGTLKHTIVGILILLVFSCKGIMTVCLAIQHFPQNESLEMCESNHEEEESKSENQAEKKAFETIIGSACHYIQPSFIYTLSPVFPNINITINPAYLPVLTPPPNPHSSTPIA